MIVPLRKIKDGHPYCRLPHVEAKLETLLALSRDEILKACRVTDRILSAYVPTECVVHLLRHAKHDNNVRYLADLMDVFSKRVARAFPVPERHLSGSGGKGVVVADLELRDYAVDHLTNLLCEDWRGYDERLDIYEVVFDRALATLRVSAKRYVGRRRNALQPLNDDLDEPEPSGEVEAAALRGTVSPMEEIEGRDYRRRLHAAILHLSDEERRLLMLLNEGIPIDSKDPRQITIARLLGCGEQTVRHRRDRIYRKLRGILGRESGQ